MNTCPKCTEQRVAVCPNGCDGAEVISHDNLSVDLQAKKKFLAHIVELEAERDAAARMDSETCKKLQACEAERDRLREIAMRYAYRLRDDDEPAEAASIVRLIEAAKEAIP